MKVRTGISDDEAVELLYDGNLNQQSFLDWSYTQKIGAIKYFEKMIRKNFGQGKKTELEKKIETTEAGTFVYSRQKLSDQCKKSTTRDKVARHLEISAAMFSKYRSISKLPDDVIDSIARLLDEKRITFEAAYRMSGLRLCEIKMLVDYIDKLPNKKVDVDKLKALGPRTKCGDMVPILLKDAIKEVLVLREHE